MEKGVAKLTPLGHQQLAFSRRGARQEPSKANFLDGMLEGYVQRFQNDLAGKPKRVETRGRPKRVPSTAEGTP